jgi:drug/metabolite transporter (DMT)-like permease
MQTAHASRAPSKLVTNLCIALLCAVWGSTWIVIRFGLRDLPPITSGGVRFIVAGLAMCVVAALFGRREGGTRPPAWLWITLGVCNFAISYGIVYSTESVLPSGLVSLLWGVFPMMMALSSHFFLPGERLHGAQWLGFVVGLGGLVLLFFTDLHGFGPRGIPAALFLFLSPLVSCLGNTLVKLRGGGMSSLALNRNAMLLGAGLLCAFAALTESELDVHWTPRAIASVAYLGLLGTTLTFGLYFWLMRYVDAHKMSLISYVTPAIGLALGAAFADEPITRYTIAGAACILLGVVLVVRGGVRSQSNFSSIRRS